MTSTETQYHKKDIATAQLKTGVMLFLNNRDLSSVITLAGAAANILRQLVKNSGKSLFSITLVECMRPQEEVRRPRKNISTI